MITSWGDTSKTDLLLKIQIVAVAKQSDFEEERKIFRRNGVGDDRHHIHRVRRIVSPGPQIEDLRTQIVVIIGCRQIFGRSGTRNELLELLRLYPIEEWLSFLSRLQAVVSADGDGVLDVQVALAEATLGDEIKAAIRGWLQNEGFSVPKVILFNEYQLGLLQQLAILYAPDEGSSTFESDSDRTNFGRALLIANDLFLLEDEVAADGIAVSIFHQYRTATLPSWTAFSRAFQFYQLDRAVQSDACRDLLEEFGRATGVNGTDFILGGECFAMEESSRTIQDHQQAWHGALRSNRCPNENEAKCRAAFETIRMGRIEALREKILAIEPAQESESTLIPLSCFPLLDLGNGRTVVINRSALGRTLFDGIRHASLTFAITLPNRQQAVEKIGRLYGYVFEEYVERLIKERFGDRAIKIPQQKFPGCADFIVIHPNRILIIESKSRHFLLKNKFRLRTSAQWRSDIQNQIELKYSMGQIKGAVELVMSRQRGQLDPLLNGIDVTNLLFAPIVVTDEEMPLPFGGWDELYSEYDVLLRDLCPAVRFTRRLRILNLDDLEMLTGLDENMDLGTILAEWSGDERRCGFGLKNYLISKQIRIGRERAVERIRSACMHLAQRLGLDADLSTTDLRSLGK